jgi:hypothetical protein
MTQLIITNVFNFSVPFNIWGCDIYGNNCILIATLNNFIPPTITLTLPPLFDTYPGLTLKFTNCVNCDHSEFLLCDLFPTAKQFQDGDVFYFMDGLEYDFQS